MAPARTVRRLPGMVMGAALGLTLLVAGCQEEVNEEAFRSELSGPWAQVVQDTVSPYWEFTRQGKIRDLQGREIGTYASAGNYRRIRVDIPGQVSFTSDFALAVQGKSLSFTSTRYHPFKRVDAELRNQALLELHRPAILQNLERLINAARTIRSEGGPRRLTYADLVGEGKPIPNLEPVAGEDYRDLEFDGGSFLRVFTSYGLELTAAE